MKNKKIRVGIDVDNVVLDFTESFIECFYNRTGITMNREEINDWNFKNYIDKKYQGKIDGEIANQMILSGEIISDMKYKLRSKEAIIAMNNNKNIEIVFITALHSDLIKVRENWFNKNLKGIDYELHFESKKSNIQVDYLIDDGVHNLDELVKYIPFENCLCIKEPYNKDSIYLNFDDLYDAYEYILNKEGLACDTIKLLKTTTF